MFDRIKKSLRRALSSRNLQNASQIAAARDHPSPPRVFRVPGSSTSPETSQASQGTQESPRKLRRAAGQQDLRSVAATNEQLDISRRSPQTPQHRRPISKKEGAIEEANVIRGELSRDGSSVLLPSGEVLSLDTQSSASPIDDIVQHEMSNPFWVDRNVPVSTETQHNHDFVDTRNPQPRDLSPSQDPTHLDIREEYTNYKTQRKRARSILANDYIPNKTHPQKRRRSSSASVRSLSPTPPNKKYGSRFGTTAPRLVHSQPELARARRESIENDKTLSAVRSRGRRVWSANDVLNALHTGRQGQLGEEVTPPPSPTISPETLKEDGYTHVLESPPARVPKLPREPLSNITEDFVPPFLKATSPTIQQQEPPTPGEVLDSTSEHSTVIIEEGDTTMVDLDDDVIISEMLDWDPMKHFGKNNTKSNHTIDSSLSTDLYDAGEDGLPKQPNIKHVLTDLDNDALYIHGALKQIKALKTKVLRHEQKMLLAKSARNYATGADAKDVAARYLLEAKAYRDAAEKAEAEAKEYRKKAEKLVENAMAEVSMIRFGADVTSEDDAIEYRRCGMCFSGPNL